MDTRYPIGPLDAGTVLDHAIYLYRDQFKLIAIVAGIVLFPVVVILDAVMLTYQEQYEAAMAAGEMPPLEYIAATLVYVFVFQCVVHPFAVGTLIYGLALRYMGRPATVGECFRAGMRRFGWLVVAAILQMIVVGVGMMLCVIPGIYATVILLPLYPIVMLESANPFEAFSRCSRLMNGERLKGLLVLFALGIISMASGVLDFVTGLKYFTFVYSDILQVLIVAFPGAVYLVFYFSARCRVENMDLDLAVQAVEEQARPEGAVL